MSKRELNRLPQTPVHQNPDRSDQGPSENTQTRRCRHTDWQQWQLHFQRESVTAVQLATVSDSLRVRRAAQAPEKHRQVSQPDYHETR